MKQYTVYYVGNSTRFIKFKREVLAESERQAVENVFGTYMPDNYFPQDDGTIKDCDGYTIADKDDQTIKYDGGYFFAEEIK